MASVNKVIIMGNAGRDAEVRYLPSGKAVAQVSIATSTRRKKDGETVEETQWHRVTFFERLAEIAGEYIKKGKPVYIEGRITYREYTDKDGAKKNSTDIIATELQLLGGRDDAEPRQAPRQAAPAPKPRTGGSGFEDMDDDIPF